MSELPACLPASRQAFTRVSEWQRGIKWLLLKAKWFG